MAGIGSDSDNGLIDAARAGDRDAFARLLERHYDRIHGLAWQLTGSRADADDIAAEVRDLKGKGVTFERYDMEGLTRDGDVYSGEGMKTAWFKDPDGNILSLFEGADA